MNKTYIPAGYKSVLDLYDTQKAIGVLRRFFEDRLCEVLNLKRVTAPLFVDPETGLNDDLSGVERAVSFDIPATGKTGQVVHSLAKWKRMALHRYNFWPGNGINTNMNAIRRDEELDNLHSIYVDQWDWEKILPAGERNLEYLKQTVREIVGVFCDTAEFIRGKYPQLDNGIKREVSFITTQELEDMYPALTPKEREHEYTKVHKTVFIMQVGDKLNSGEPHDMRAPDYDDWKLNGDLLFWSDTLEREMELSSMGIRVDAKSLDEQLIKANADERRKLPFHRMLLAGELPLTIGGGIGQSRACMLLLCKAHVGEVQTSIWDDESLETCEAAGVMLL